MKIFKVLIICWALLAGTDLSAQSAKKAKNETVTFDVNMHCDGCRAKIEKNIAWVKGVKDLEVRLDEKKVTVTYDPKKTDEETLKDAIQKLGYECEKPISHEKEM